MTVAAPVARPPRRAAPKGWGAVVGILATVVLVTTGGYFVSAAVPGEPETSAPEGPDRVDVGATLTVAVEPGWSVVRADPAGVGVVLSNGTGLLEVYPALGGYDDPLRLLADYVAEVLEPAASQLTVADPSAVAVRPADASVRAGYQGTFPAFAYPLEGAVTAVVASTGTAVIFDASAPQGQLLTVIDDVDRMIGGSEIR